jgi:hypothetical protein
VRHKHPKHLAFVRQLPCVVCQNDISTEAAHIRMKDGEIRKPITGIAIKPDDCYVVPLCSSCHRRQHDMSEAEFWADAMIDPVKIALAIYAHSGDFERCEQIARAGWRI